ncbi:MAG TPA: M1 family metallopeptidase [Rhizomicrobium sp.]|nr:M1 family metallopeptidase [Rhizomicrobium sp.]
MRRAFFACLAASLLPLAAHAADPNGRVVLPGDVQPTRYDLAIVTDAARMTFTGNVKIALDVKSATKTIQLNAADLAFKTVTLDGKPAPKAVFDDNEGTATFTFPADVKPGKHTLAIAYSGKINPHPAGLFALDYTDKTGAKKRALFTQFENSDARRFVPSWDEPNRKAVFALTATVPAGDFPVSNMPIASTDKLKGGLKRVHFMATPRMSSYLLFFGTGDFERVSRKVNGVDVGVVFKRGDGDKAQYALDEASKFLPYYEDYFGQKFPLPKLDMIAGPGTSQTFGAMENWGAIFYFERALMLDPKAGSEADRRNISVDVAHEMAHQWFGDLVTMDWWEDLWLNEGFASWMENKANDHFHPEWHMWMASIDNREGAMREDARAGTHPIITPIKDVAMADQAFDNITYQKGQAVIRMLESYVGEDAFRAGIRAYMKDHAYGNTVTDDLWREIDKVSPTPITQIAHDFTLQAGVPLIRVTKTTTGLHLTQERVVDDGGENPPTSWHVPVVVKSLKTGVVWHGIVSRDAPADVPLPNGEGGLVNAGQTAYFRTAYDDASFQDIVAAFPGLSPEDELGLINDARDDGYVNVVPFGQFLTLASKVTTDTNAQVLDTLEGRMSGIDQLYRDLPGQKAYRAFVQKVLGPVFAKIGWDAKPGEDSNIPLLRNDLIDTLSQIGDPAVIAEANRRFDQYRANPDSMSGDMREAVLRVVARNADAARWEQLRDLAKATNDSALKEEFYTYLGAAADKAIAQKALDLSLTGEVPVTVRLRIVGVVSGQHPEMAFDFFVAHRDEFNKILEPDARDRFPPELASSSFDPAMIGKLNAYADKYIAPTARGDCRKAEGAITYYAKIRATSLPEIDKWLAKNGK